MAKSDKPNSGSQKRPTSSPDDLLKTGKNSKIELTEEELKKVSGGIDRIVIQKL